MSWLRTRRKTWRRARPRPRPMITMTLPRLRERVKVFLESLHSEEVPFIGVLQGSLYLHIGICCIYSYLVMFNSIQYNIIYFSHLFLFLRWSNCLTIILGTDGRVDMKLICGIRIAGTNLKTRKEDKVCHFIFSHFLMCITFKKNMRISNLSVFYFGTFNLHIMVVVVGSN